MCKRSIMKPQNESARPALPGAPPHPHACTGCREESWRQGQPPQDGKEAEGSLARFFAERGLLADLEGYRSLSRADEKPGDLTVKQPANPALFCHLKACTSHDTWPWVPLSAQSPCMGGADWNRESWGCTGSLSGWSTEMAHWSLIR